MICKQCVPKYTKHSLIFNQCIGAANEIFVMVFLVALVLIGMTGVCELLRCAGQGYFLAIFLGYWNLYIAWHGFC